MCVWEERGGDGFVEFRMGSPAADSVFGYNRVNLGFLEEPFPQFVALEEPQSGFLV